MTQKTFLTIASFIACTVGLVATLFPAMLLASKDTSPNEATDVWMTEVGILLLALGITNFMVRAHETSDTLKALFIGNIIIQIGLFLIEFIAYQNGIITLLSGVAPNLTLHILLAIGFYYYLKKM